MAAGEVSIGGAARFALSALRTHWRALWGALALNALFATVSVAGDFGQNPTLFVGGMAAQLVTTTMVFAAVFRLTLGDRHTGDAAFAPRPMGLQWTKIETRVLAANVLFGLFLTFVAFLVILAVVAVIMGVLQAQGAPVAAIQTPQGMAAALGQGPLMLIVIVLMAAFFYVSLRLSLIGPATADQGAIRIFRTWPLTRGQVLRILGATLLLQLPIMVLANLLTMPLLGGQTPATLTGGMMAAFAAAAGKTPVVLAPSAAFSAALISGIATGALVAPLQAAVAAYFYRHLAPQAAK